VVHICLAELQGRLKDRRMDRDDLRELLRAQKQHLQEVINFATCLGPNNPGGPVEWLRGVVGCLAHGVLGVGGVIYVYRSAGPFGAAQTLGSKMRYAESGRALLLWIEQTPEAADLPCYPDSSVHADLTETALPSQSLRDNLITSLRALSSDEERRRVFLATFPPKRGRGFEGHDEELENLIEAAARDGNRDLHSFLVSAFAE